MESLQIVIKKIDKFFFDLYTNKQSSNTEIVDFFYNYVDYILLYNGIDSSKITKTMHLNTKFNDTCHDFSVKQKRKKRQKQRNKENIKKAQHHQYAQEIARCLYIPENKTFDIYLNNNVHIYDLEDLENFTVLLSSLGHEVEHLVQEYKLPSLCRQCEDIYDNLLKLFSIKQTENLSKNYLQKLAKKLHAHADNFNITNTCEINADNNSVVYFNELFKIIRDTTSREKHYYYFLYNICIDLECIQQSRENLYKMCLKQDFALKKALVKKFNIDKETLLIP